MEEKIAPPRLSLLSRQRPLWQKILVWGALIVLVVNVLPILFLMTGNVFDNVFVQLLLLIAAPLAASLPFGGLNLLRTAANKATADFTRRDDPSTGGYVYEVRPARASWLSVLIPLPLFAFLALWGAFAAWIFYTVVILYFLFAAIFVLPGARYRRPVSISVSPQGLQSDDVNLPIDRIAELEVGYVGLKLSADPLMPGIDGVSTSAMIGRGLGRRQAARSFALLVRGDGDSQTSVLAGGLTEGCAKNLGSDMTQAVARMRSSARAT